MIRGSLRTALLSSAAATMLIASAGTANAIEYNFGSVQVFFDTTLSAGVSMRTSETNTAYLPASNGGPAQVTTNNVNFALLPTSASPAGGDGLTLLTDPTTPAGSINGDDGRLNFDQGDLTSGIAKMTNDIQVKWENFTLFSRINSYYDAVLDSDSSYARSNLVDGQADAARDIRLLDLYVAGNFDVGGLPLTVRAGKQVINWGEGTFLLNGVNGSMPIDVGAFRRPGAEVKEGLLPVWALDASIGLPFNLSLEAFYQLQQAEYQLDRPGTPFSTSDVVSYGSGVGGNENAVSFLTGSYGGTNCNTNNVIAVEMQGALPVGDLRNCADLTGINQYLHYENKIPTGQTEAIRLALSDSSIVARDQDRYAKDSGQYGIAARWYSEELNNTEFGFYFTNTHSRLPIAGERVSVDPTAAGNTWAPFTTGENASGTGRGAAFSGCNGLAGSPFAPAATSTDPSTNLFYGVPLGLTAEMVAQLNQTVGGGTDPVMDAMEALAVQYYLNEVGGDFAAYTIPAPVATGFDALTGGYLTANRTFAGMDLSALAATLAPAGAGALAGVTVAANSGLQAALINCALVALQSNAAIGATVLTDGAQVMIASTGFGGPASLGLYLEYPEDIRMFGFSFNTTVGTWGLQGDFTYRPNQPVQLDTDQITIAALNSTCLFHGILGATTMSSLVASDTYGSSCGDLGVGANSLDLSGVERTKIYTAQVGTTATFTNSNPLVGMTGADLGILVTEVGMMYAPDAPEAVGNARRWGNVCTNGGTDLPLGGFLSLASRQGCRPTTTSWGYVLLGQLQYNNAFGTAFSLQPTIAWNHGVSGNSPAPLSNYREGAKSLSLQLNGNYLGNWRGGISYTAFMGNEKYVGNNDQDFVSANISYAF
ncbi:MAG: DUF1302 family protein [Parvibaculum sp.]